MVAISNLTISVFVETVSILGGGGGGGRKVKEYAFARVQLRMWGKKIVPPELATRCWSCSNLSLRDLILLECLPVYMRRACV